jgi:mannose-6-phosphate isomerase
MKQRVEKPWGHEIIWAHTGDYVGKMLFIRKGHKLSLQYHRTKEETIYLHSGEMLFTVGEEGALTVKTLRPGDAYHIPPGLRHRMEAVQDCEVFEVSTPQLDDVVRLEDAYGRAGL